MNVLVVGQGAREHAIAWKIAQSPKVKKIYCAPGNPGMQSLGECPGIAASDIEALADFAAKRRIDLTVVGPEAPLAAGIVDVFRQRGLRIFGPDRQASRLEASKIFAKRLMKKVGVPTADYEEFSDADTALRYLERIEGPVVVKADGLAAGKGVTVAQNRGQAEDAVRQAMEKKSFGQAGARVIIEECLEGEEVSLIGISDGKDVVLLASSQDHKRIFDGDRGPNTGGMGAYSPAPVATRELEAEAAERVFMPVIREFAAGGHPFKGFLYAGVMVTAEGMKVLEFNVRLGDPEAQVILPRLESDFVDLLEASVGGHLGGCPVRWKDESYVTVVLASAGYPASSSKGDLICGIAEAEAMPGVMVFHAGTGRAEDGSVVTAGGRVLSVVAGGPSIDKAVRAVYEAVDKIRFEGRQFRTDIAHRAREVRR